MSERIPPTSRALREAIELSEVILRNIELSELPLSNIALKSSRLARLLNDFAHQKLFEYEAGGYPSSPDGVPPEVWKLAEIAGRQYNEKDKEEIKTYAYLESIDQLENELKAAQVGIEAARDRDVSVSSANPNQFVSAGASNVLERQGLQTKISKISKRLSGRKSFLYQYVLIKNHELKYSGIAEDVFSRIRDQVDSKVGEIVPDSVQKFTAVYDNLISENPEDWSNAVHSCRRILQDLADATFPPQADRITEHGGKSKTIKLGPDNYINRIICFVEDNSDSQRFNEIVGSHLKFIGERLDSVFKAAQKGSHDNIVSREEADRYVVYTYMVVGDILSLKQ